MNLENINKPSTEIENPNKGEKNNQEEDFANEKKEDQKKPDFENLENYDGKELSEDEATSINKKVESGEYLEEPELIEQSALAGDQISEEIIKKQLQDAKKYDGKKGFIMSFKKKKALQVASKVVLAYMLLFKGYDAFAGNAEQETSELNEHNRIEMSDENRGGGDDNEKENKTFEMDASDLSPENEPDQENDKEQEKNTNEKNESEDMEKEDFNSEKASVLDIDQYYEHNKAEINEDGKEQIVSHINDFFEDMQTEEGDLDSDKLRNFLDKSVKIKASANELQRIGGNEELAMDRGEALKSVVDNNINEISNHLEDLGLEKDDVAKVIDKLENAKVEIPDSEEGEKGVTYITDMENPETGENYTETEVKDLKENNPDKYQELLAEARSVKIDLAAEGEVKVNKMESQKAEIEIDDTENPEKVVSELGPHLEDMGDYQEILIAADNSGSTHDDNESMIKKIHKNFNDIVRSSTESEIEEIKVASFSDKLDKVKSFDSENSDKAFEKLYSQDAEGSSFERAVDAALKMVENADENKKSLAYIETDEMIQNASLEEVETLKDKAAEKNIDIKFLLKPLSAEDGNGKSIELEDQYVEVDLEEIYNNMAENHQKGVEKTFDSYKSYYGDHYSDEEIEKMISNKVEGDISINKDLSDIKLDNGTKLKFTKEN